MMEDYEYIKKYYGEHVARLCREIIPELFEEKGLVPNLMVVCFAPHKELYQDMITLGKYNIRNYMYTRLTRKEELFTSPKSAKELLQEAGYQLFICTRPEDINYFKSCYDENEVLCTFKDGVENRFKDAYYFFLATPDAFTLHREDFSNPNREDHYSKSLICLQINRVGNSVRMTSRYNHSVDFADSMFSNNLDNIIPGLRYAFERDFHIKVNHQETVGFAQLMSMNYVEYGPYRTLFKYNEMIDDKYYCPNNIVLEDNEVHLVPKDSCFLLDYYVIDFKDKKISTYDDSIPDYYHDKIFQKCEYFGGKEYDTFKITFDDHQDLYLTSDKMNRILSVTDNSSTDIGDHYFSYCSYIREVTAGKAQFIGDDFVSGSSVLSRIYTPYVEEVGDNFASSNIHVRDFNMDYLVRAGHNCFQNNKGVREIYLPSFLYSGNYFFGQNDNIRTIDLPLTQYLGSESFGWVDGVDAISIPELRDMGSDCFFTDYECQEYAEAMIMKNFDRGEQNEELDMAEIQSVGRSR